MAAASLTLAAQEPSAHRSRARELSAMSLEELGDIEITVTTFSNRSQKLGRVAGAVYVITRERIERSGLTSVPELLRLAPGVQVARVNGSQWSVSVRGTMGVYAPRLLVLVDGRSIYSPVFSGVYWDMGMPPVEDIDRIEIVRGPGATIWGANAALGVINIVTLHTRDTQGGLVAGGVGNQDRAFGLFRYGDTAGKTSWRTWVRAEAQAALKTASGGDAADGWDAEQAGFRMDGAGLGGTWMLQGAASVNTGTLPGALFSLTTQALEHRPFDTTGATGHLSGEYRRPVAHSGELRVNFFYDQMVKQFTSDRLTHASTWDGAVRYDLNLGSHHALSTGGGVRAIRVSVPGQGGNYFDPPLMSYANSNLFAQDETRWFGGRLVFTFGSKIEHNHYTCWGMEPSASLLYQVARRHSVWVSAARSLRTPSMLERAVHSPLSVLPGSRLTAGLPIEVELTGNADFGNERVNDLQAGYRGELPGRFSLSVSLYRDLYQHYRSLAAGAPFLRPGPVASIVIPSLGSNFIDGKGKGVETTLGWQRLRWWRLEATHTQASARTWAMPTAPAATTALDVFQPPRNRWTVQSSWNIGQRVEFDVLNYWSGRTSNISYMGNLRPDAHDRLDLRLSYRLKRNWSVSFAGQNLLTPRFAEGRPEVLSDYSYVKRSFNVKWVWRF